MRYVVIIILILAGCGDVPTRTAAPSGPMGPADPAEPDPTGQEPTMPEPHEPNAFEAPCDEAIEHEGTLYFYAQAAAPSRDFAVSNCFESGKPFEAPTCEPAMQFAIEDGVVSVLCGEWLAGAETASFLADFVRFEETTSECESQGAGGFGGSGGMGALDGSGCG